MRRFHQRPPQESHATSTSTWIRNAARSEARYGVDARCLAHHRHRSAARSRIGAGRDQHRPQPGVERHQPRPGRRRPARGSIPARRRNRRRCKAQAEVAPIKSLAVELSALKAAGGGVLKRLPAQRPAGPVSTRPSRSTWRTRDERLSHHRRPSSSSALLIGEKIILLLCRIFGFTPSCRSAPRACMCCSGACSASSTNPVCISSPRSSAFPRCG